MDGARYSAHTGTFAYDHAFWSKANGQVDQLEDRYLGMVEAGGSNPPLSTNSLANLVLYHLRYK